VKSGYPHADVDEIHSAMIQRRRPTHMMFHGVHGIPARRYSGLAATLSPEFDANAGLAVRQRSNLSLEQEVMPLT
jgi:hypothetical protein